MNWIPLTTEEQFSELLERSKDKLQLIYKHSTRCSLSTVIKQALDDEDPPPGVDFYFLNVIADRALSGKIARHLHIHHESPQVILLKDGECVFSQSHFSITMDEIRREVERASLVEQH